MLYPVNIRSNISLRNRLIQVICYHIHELISVDVKSTAIMDLTLHVDLTIATGVNLNSFYGYGLLSWIWFYGPTKEGTTTWSRYRIEERHPPSDFRRTGQMIDQNYVLEIIVTLLVYRSREFTHGYN